MESMLSVIFQQFTLPSSGVPYCYLEVYISLSLRSLEDARMYLQITDMPAWGVILYPAISVRLAGAAFGPAPGPYQYKLLLLSS